MASRTLKAILAFAILVCVFSQQPDATTAPTAPTAPTASRTFPNPDPSWSKFQVKSCCPQGFYEVLNYCVRCKAPNVFDAIDSRCKPCPQDFRYSNATSRCEYFKCDAPRAVNPANNQCECKVVNGTIMTYNAGTNECVCPSNKPLWNGKYCVDCPPGTNFDEKEKQCYHCPEGFVRDPVTHSCHPQY